MTYPADISSKPAASILPVVGLFAVIGFCVWRGRRVHKMDWKEDDNNPANWYLRNPNKYKGV